MERFFFYVCTLIWFFDNILIHRMHAMVIIVQMVVLAFPVVQRSNARVFMAGLDTRANQIIA